MRHSPGYLLSTFIIMFSVCSFLAPPSAIAAGVEKSDRTVTIVKEKDSFSKSDEPHKECIVLRSSHKALNNAEVNAMLKGFNFFSIVSNKKGNFKNDYERKSVHGVKVVIDRATGLMWHKSGSFTFLSWSYAREWVNNLNQRAYAGFSDWRLPTVEEAVSLLESRKRYGGLYIDPIFDSRQPYIWTGDTKEGSGDGVALSVYFDDARIRWDETNSFNRNFVRPVRTCAGQACY
ncbi:MAG: DUF1566 domain-containing protein [Planctomycetes bacterium]|nr:DUF1566 domain-containing protein [Planctomycetota bacterium]